MKLPTSAKETGSTSRALRAALREPLVHFLALGLALFAVYGAANRGPARAPKSNQIELTFDDLRQLQIGFAPKWQRPPTQEEMVALVEARIREEILYREALAMGLDKDDTIVKRRMVQKMEFLAEDVSGAREPKSDELRAWFEKNPGRFARPGLVTFRHLYFSPDRRGARAHDDAAQMLGKLAGKPQNWRGAASLGSGAPRSPWRCWSWSFSG
jgi:peptidyl-prolyl cis-trans isomerase C